MSMTAVRATQGSLGTPRGGFGGAGRSGIKASGSFLGMPRDGFGGAGTAVIEAGRPGDELAPCLMAMALLLQGTVTDSSSHSNLKSICFGKRQIARSGIGVKSNHALLVVEGALAPGNGHQLFLIIS